MMPTSTRARRNAMLAGKLLAFILLIVSPRALFASPEHVTKAEDSKRPKAPKNVVRAEPIRIVAADEKQAHAPNPARQDAVAKVLDAGLGGSARIQALPRKAFAELTKPDYLKSGSPGSPQIPLSPPA